MKILEHYLKEKFKLLDEEVEDFNYGFIRGYLRCIGIAINNLCEEHWKRNGQWLEVCKVDGVEFNCRETIDVVGKLIEINDNSEANKRLMDKLNNIPMSHFLKE